jgi:hypothetical protein
MSSQWTRRTLLAGLASGIAGCSSFSSDSSETPTQASTDTPPPSSTPTATSSPTPTRTQTPRPTATQTPTPIFVDVENGRDSGPGTEDDPLESIQAAFDIVQPGQTIHVRPGDYREVVRTKQGGTPENPITLTGPTTAIFRGNPTSEKPLFGFSIEHSHVHIRGMTFNGLHDPSNPDDPESYVRTLISTPHTPQSPEGYHRDLVIKPHAIGNTLRPLIHVYYSEEVEIGEFRMIGPPGLAMLQFGDDENHNGEVVYVGTSLASLDSSYVATNYFDNQPDKSNNIHIHHIDNSAGHPHAELVDIKAGCHNVLVEYCTDRGGASHEALTHGIGFPASIRLRAYDSVVRWCDISEANGHGIGIGAFHITDQSSIDPPEEVRNASSNNKVYGNKITDSKLKGIAAPFEGQGIGAQKVVCGNEVTGETAGGSDTPCPQEIPEGQGIGHTGGDSPWS